MNQFASLFLPAMLGLIAGMTHGVVSHSLDLPMTLGEQLTLPSGTSQPLRD